MSSAAASWGSASIPIGLDSATTARCSPSVASNSARRPADSAVGIDHVGQLAATVQDGETVGATDEGEPVAPGEGIEERGGPDVLVQVDGHGSQI